MVVGQRGAQFWKEREAALRELERTILADAGHTPGDAPRALLEAASGLAQAVAIRDAAFARIGEDGGPLTSLGRGRRALRVWQDAGAAVERYLRLLGLRRVPRHVDPLEAVRRAVDDANRDQVQGTAS